MKDFIHGEPTGDTPEALCDQVRRGYDSEFPALDGCAAVPRATPEVGLFDSAYDFIFEMVVMLAARTGHLRQELVGFEFRDGVPMPARAVKIEQSDVLGRRMQQMLERWPVVGHIFQGWTVPNAHRSDYHHLRHEVIVIALHSREAACMATCRINRQHPSRTTESAARREQSISVDKGRLRALSRDRRGV